MVFLFFFRDTIERFDCANTIKRERFAKSFSKHSIEDRRFFFRNSKLVYNTRVGISDSERADDGCKFFVLIFTPGIRTRRKKSFRLPYLSTSITSVSGRIEFGGYFFFFKYIFSYGLKSWNSDREYVCALNCLRRVVQVMTVSHFRKT